MNNWKAFYEFEQKKVSIKKRADAEETFVLWCIRLIANVNVFDIGSCI